MKKLLIIILLLFGINSFGQEVPFETLEVFSKEMSKLQYEVNGKTYNDGTTNYEISFPEANFTVAFNSQLATNSVYKKANGLELLYLSENFSLSRLSGFTTELIDNNIILYKLDFGKFTVTTKIYEEGKLINTTYNNNLILYAKYNKNKTGLNSDFFKTIFELSTKKQIEMGLIKKEKLDIENKDLLNLEKEDFVKKHPNSIRTKQLRIDIAKQKEQVILFMDEIANSFKIKIGMTEEEFSKKNPEIAKELFKKKNLYISDGGNYRSYSSYKKVPQVSTLVFENKKLSNTSYYKQFNSVYDRLNFFNDNKDFVKASFSPKDYEIGEFDDRYYINIRHPKDSWALTIYYYKPATDKFSKGIPMSYHFRSFEKKAN